ncbi:MAG: KTSC domain-containing protein [Opitutales bacterium]|jgi:hypothetical protein
MERRQIISTYFNSVGYDPATRTLEVEFLQGDIYQYYDISEFIYRGLMSAHSRGSFFYSNIKGAGFNFSKIK